MGWVHAESTGARIPWRSGSQSPWAQPENTFKSPFIIILHDIARSSTQYVAEIGCKLPPMTHHRGVPVSSAPCTMRSATQSKTETCFEKRRILLRIHSWSNIDKMCRRHRLLRGHGTLAFSALAYPCCSVFRAAPDFVLLIGPQSGGPIAIHYLHASQYYTNERTRSMFYFRNKNEPRKNLSVWVIFS